MACLSMIHPRSLLTKRLGGEVNLWVKLGPTCLV